MDSVDRQAIDSVVVLDDESKKRLSDYWQDKPLVLVFLRHYG